MKRIIVTLFLVACSTQSPHTPQSERQARLRYSPGDCLRTCPTGKYLSPIEPQATHILEDCCKDSDGIGWGSCAWNMCGVREDCRRAFDAKALDNN